VGIIKAKYLEHFYGGSCKGNNRYWDFERIYFSFGQDTQRIRESIKYPAQNYDNGSCGSPPPNPEGCIQFAFGYPKNKSKIIDAPILIIGDSIYFCTQLIDSINISNYRYTQVFRFNLNSYLNQRFGFVNELYFNKSEGIIQIKSKNKGEWYKN
jgi:hypothetical protein